MHHWVKIPCANKANEHLYFIFLLLDYTLGLQIKQEYHIYNFKWNKALDTRQLF